MATKQIISMLPGIFYRKPAPDQPVYKSEGDAVAVGDIVGLVEVMKTFHEVKAESAGTLVRFLIDNEDAVLAGQPVAEISD